MAKHKIGDLIYIAGEMISFKEKAQLTESHLFADAQLGLIVDEQDRYLLVWFPEFGTEKKENVIVYAPLDTPTTKIWGVESAMASAGAKDFWAKAYGATETPS
jgi:hypothetical protein